MAEDNEGLVLDGSHRDDVVLDKEADVEEVDKEVANVVDEFCHVGERPSACELCA